MSLLPDTASFNEKVQDCFVAFRGRGLSLSPLDAELVEEWAALSVPFEVVARGIRKAAEAALWDAPDGSASLQSVRACRRHVEAEIKKYLKRSAGETGPSTGSGQAVKPFHLERHKKLCAALRKLAREQEGLAPAIGRWLARLPEPADFDQSSRQEDLVLALLARALPWPKRAALLREARNLVQNAGATSPSARRESFRFHRAALVRHALAVPAFW